MSSVYPTISNCNYETNETDVGRAVHAAHRAVRSGRCQYRETVDAVAALEETLTEELTASGEYERGELSEQACAAAEEYVAECWARYQAMSNLD